MEEDIVPEGRNAIKVNLIGENISHLMGQVLTIIDASTEGEKNKAMKDLVKEKFSDKQKWFSELSWKEQEKEGCGHQPAQSWESGLVPFKSSNKFSFKN